MNKPEWFELTEKDGGKTHFEVKRGLKSFALAIPLLAIGAGVVFAQTSNESPATAEETTIAVASAAPSVTQSTKPSITSTVAQPKATIGTPPLPPTGGDDEDEDDDRDHKRGERNHDDEEDDD
jgi:hypothetical protein